MTFSRVYGVALLKTTDLTYLPRALMTQESCCLIGGSVSAVVLVSLMYQNSIHTR